MKFESVLDRWERRELSQAEAAEVLGMSERTFRRPLGRAQHGGVNVDGGGRLRRPPLKIGGHRRARLAKAA